MECLSFSNGKSKNFDCLLRLIQRHNKWYNACQQTKVSKMKSFRPSVFVALLACMAISGCAMLGVAIHYPMIQVQNDTAAVPAGADLGDAILRAASARRWVATVTTPGVIRCRFDSRSWNMEVDVRYSGSTFSIDYVRVWKLKNAPEPEPLPPAPKKN